MPSVIFDKVSQFCNMDIGCHILPVLAVIVLVYGGYYVAVISSCEKMVFSKKPVDYVSVKKDY